MSHSPSTVTSAVFEPALREIPNVRAETRLPVPVAARIIAVTSLGLWFLIVKLALALAT